MKLAPLLAGAVLLALASLPSCSSDDCNATQTCSGAGVVPEGGSEGGADQYVPPNCKSPDDPSLDPVNCLDDGFAIYLSQKGNDSMGDGTKARPFRSLARALDEAKQKAGRVVACKGDYTGAPAVFEGTKLGLFGGFDCDTWAYAKENLTSFKTDKDRVPLTLRRAPGSVLQDVAFLAEDAEAPGASSIALWIADDAASLSRVQAAAGKGAAGTEGKTADYTFADPMTLKGNDAPNGTNGGPATNVTCPSGTVANGGKGGDIGNQGTDGMPLPPIGGTRGSVATCGGGGTGNDGANGLPGAAGSGASRSGELSNTTWTPAGGSAGTPGPPGGGGGGGYGAGGAGGGGGAGGCGGAAGQPGGPGGSSFAIVAVNAELKLALCNLSTKDGGEGGKGSLGQEGQPQGGTRGDGSGGACDGGNGGAGGKGGAGGGGAAGNSIGILHRGPEPVIDDKTNIQVGSAGAQGTTAGADQKTTGAKGHAARIKATDASGALPAAP